MIKLKEGTHYITRNGLSVYIKEVKDPAKATFNYHGFIEQTHTKRGINRVRPTLEWNIWTSKGMFTAFEGHPLDIVEEKV